MTHLKQAQEWLKARVVPDDKLPCEHVYEQVLAFARFQDEQEKPKECDGSCKDGNRLTTHLHSPQPTPVPEELKDIGCPHRCNGDRGCPHHKKKLCGCRDCAMESKLNELIRYLKSRE